MYTHMIEIFHTWGSEELTQPLKHARIIGAIENSIEKGDSNLLDVTSQEESQYMKSKTSQQQQFKIHVPFN